MMTGIDRFCEHFAGAEAHYALIGGAACDLIFSEAGLAFHATKDIDMVLCVEVVDAAFAGKFQEFLKGGGYEAAQQVGCINPGFNPGAMHRQRSPRCAGRQSSGGTLIGLPYSFFHSRQVEYGSKVAKRRAP